MPIYDSFLDHALTPLADVPDSEISIQITGRNKYNTQRCNVIPKTQEFKEG